MKIIKNLLIVLSALFSVVNVSAQLHERQESMGEAAGYYCVIPQQTAKSKVSDVMRRVKMLQDRAQSGGKQHVSLAPATEQPGLDRIGLSQTQKQLPGVSGPVTCFAFKVTDEKEGDGWHIAYDGTNAQLFLDQGKFFGLNEGDQFVYEVQGRDAQGNITKGRKVPFTEGYFGFKPMKLQKVTTIRHQL